MPEVEMPGLLMSYPHKFSNPWDWPKKVEYIEMPAHLQNQYQYFTEANMFSFFKKKSLIFTPIEIGVNSYMKYLEENF